MAHDLGSRKHLRPKNRFNYSVVNNNLKVAANNGYFQEYSRRQKTIKDVSATTRGLL